MHHREMNENYVFRKFKCGLSKEEVALLCFKSERVVTGWDEGKKIPPECKRLMKQHINNELSHLESWKGFKMTGDKLELPTGDRVTPQQILTGIALLQIESELELKTTTKLLRFSREISKHINSR